MGRRKTCRVCGSDAVVHHSNQTDRRKGLPGLWSYSACSNCATVFADPMPSVADLDGYYRAYYASAGPGSQTMPTRGGHSDFARKIYHMFSGDVDPRDFIPARPEERVLDYGSGMGGYMRYFAAKGVKISGAEVAGTAIDSARAHGLDVREVESMERIPFGNAEFDTVYLMQVLEHLQDPDHFMAELNRVLKQNGGLYVAVPNRSSVWNRVFKDNWLSGWFAPFHLFQFDRAALALMARRHGFSVMQVWARTPESWFRLNLRAVLCRNDVRVEGRRIWIDRLPVRVLLALALRGMEVFVRERDCLVVKLVKM